MRWGPVRLLLTIMLAVVGSALMGFAALVVCSLAGFAKVTLEQGVFAAPPMTLLGLLVYAVAAHRKAPAKALRTALWCLSLLALLPLATILVAPIWPGRDSASATVMACVCLAIATGQWAVFRWYATRGRPLPQMRVGRQP